MLYDVQLAQVAINVQSLIARAGTARARMSGAEGDARKRRWERYTLTRTNAACLTFRYRHASRRLRSPFDRGAGDLSLPREFNGAILVPTLLGIWRMSD